LFRVQNKAQNMNDSPIVTKFNKVRNYKELEWDYQNVWSDDRHHLSVELVQLDILHQSGQDVLPRNLVENVRVADQGISNAWKCRKVYLSSNCKMIGWIYLFLVCLTQLYFFFFFINEIATFSYIHMVGLKPTTSALPTTL
jgi:hypothetical protein